MHTELRMAGALLADRGALTPDTPSPGRVLEIMDGPEGPQRKMRNIIISDLELAPIGIEPSCNADTDARSCGEFSKLPVSKEPLRARTPTIHHRTHLGTVRSPPAREGDRPSARLPPAPHSRSSGFREARCGSRLRLRLLEDRRPEVFGNHDEAQPKTSGWRPV